MLYCITSGENIRKEKGTSAECVVWAGQGLADVTSVSMIIFFKEFSFALVTVLLACAEVRRVILCDIYFISLTILAIHAG